ncbi:MAG: hypothetical protein SVR81_02030 [Chloroflexota bacterium]|nr:hypothetical protein [Chloroflexota bacterium]
MNLWQTLFGHPAVRQLKSVQKQEYKRLLEKLIQIGKTDDFLSLHPGGPFDVHCHHTEARRIGVRLNEIGGLPLMQAARAHVKRKLKATLAEHLDHCWQDVGGWQA